MSGNKDLRQLRRLATKQGWTVTSARRSPHLHWRLPNGELGTVTSATPSDSHAIKNIRADLRKAGLDC